MHCTVQWDFGLYAFWSSRKGTIETEWINAIIIVININISPLFDKFHCLKYYVQLDCTMHLPSKKKNAFTALGDSLDSHQIEPASIVLVWLETQLATAPRFWHHKQLLQEKFC